MHTRRRFVQIIGMLGATYLLSGCDLLKGFAPSSAPPTQPAQEVEVTLKEGQILPASITVKAGKVRFVVQNAGTMTHGFELESQMPSVKFDEAIDPFPAGQTRTLEVELTPGQYQYYCQVSGHKDLGMKGSLLVQP